MTEKIQKNDLKEKEKEHFASVLFTFQKTYEEKFRKRPKMTRNTLKSPKTYQKINPKMKKMTLNLKMSKNYKKLPIKFTFL
jgi:hypothetical protein